MFKNAQEIRKVSKSFTDDTFQKELDKVSNNIKNNIENAANRGKFSTEAHFEHWYLNENMEIIEKIIDDLKASGYNVSQFFDASETDSKYLKIGW